MTTKKKQPRVQIWVDADLAREVRIMAAERGVRTANVASEVLRAGLFLPKNRNNQETAKPLRAGVAG